MIIYKLTGKAKESLTFLSWQREKSGGAGYITGGCGLSEYASNEVSKSCGKPQSLWKTWKLGAIVEHSKLAEQQFARFAYENMGRSDLAIIVDT